MITIKLPKEVTELQVVLPTRRNPEAGFQYIIKFVSDDCFSITLPTPAIEALVTGNRKKKYEAVTEGNIFPFKDISGVTVRDYVRIYFHDEEMENPPEEDATFSMTLIQMLPKANIYVSIRDNTRIITIDE